MTGLYTKDVGRTQFRLVKRVYEAREVTKKEVIHLGDHDRKRSGRIIRGIVGGFPRFEKDSK